MKRAIVSAIDWPGWCRSGRDEAEALASLVDFGPRYARVLQGADLGFLAPSGSDQFEVIERIEGNATTDFGAPAVVPSADKIPLEFSELGRINRLFRACWDAFDHAVQEAAGKELRKGPRGGGRNLEKIIHHVIEADKAYLRRLAWKPGKNDGLPQADALIQTRLEIEQALAAGVREGLPDKGPRGGLVWPLRYFIRRAAWHVLDHTWEIEDRII